MKLLYIKNYLIELKPYLNNDGEVKFINFNLNDFISNESQKDSLKDFFDLKDVNKYSPFDYTELYDIFQRHFLNYIVYPISLNMIDNFGYNDLENFCFYQIQKEIELLLVQCQINKKKELIYCQI